MLPDQSIARQNYACQLLVMKRIKTYFLLILTTLRDSKEKTTHTWSHTWIHLVTFDPSLDVYTLWVVEWSCQVVKLSRLDFRDDQVQARLSTLRLNWTLSHCREPSACCLVWIFREGWHDVSCLNQCIGNKFCWITLTIYLLPITHSNCQQGHNLLFRITLVIEDSALWQTALDLCFRPSETRPGCSTLLWSSDPTDGRNRAESGVWVPTQDVWK